MNRFQYKESEIFVNPHAVFRYRQRTGSSKSEIEIVNKLLLALKLSYEVELKPKYRATALLNHDFIEAKYFRYKEWILVLRGKELITIHEGTANRWGRDMQIERKIDDEVRNQPVELPFKREKTEPETESKSKSEEFFESPAYAAGEWGKWCFYECCFNGKDKTLVLVKKKKSRGGLKFFQKNVPILYCIASELKGLIPKENEPDWNTGRILNIENGVINVVNVSSGKEKSYA